MFGKKCWWTFFPMVFLPHTISSFHLNLHLNVLYAACCFSMDHWGYFYNIHSVFGFPLTSLSVAFIVMSLSVAIISFSVYNYYSHWINIGSYQILNFHLQNSLLVIFNLLSPQKVKVLIKSISVWNIFIVSFKVFAW